MSQHKHEMMTPQHHLWPTFRGVLEREIKLSVKCDHTHKDTYRAMSDLSTEPCCQLMSIGYFYAEGGFCSCEVLLNVGAERKGKVRRRKVAKKGGGKK